MEISSFLHVFKFELAYFEKNSSLILHPF